MASRPHFYTSEEVLDEIYADPGSDFNRESSSDEIEEYHDQQSSSESSENEEMIENDNQSINNKDQGANAQGRGHNRGNRAARRAVRRNRQQEDALLEIQWTSDDRQPRIPQFTARQGRGGFRLVPLVLHSLIVCVSSSDSLFSDFIIYFNQFLDFPF